MRVGLMTFPNSTSYGAVLQMYALHKVLTEAGYQVEVINYHNRYMKSEKHTDKEKKRGLVLKKLVHRKQYSAFLNFEKSLTKYPRKPIHKAVELKQLGSRYTHVVCGSDQVWNPNITGSDMSFFLDFCGNTTKRVSYAPSFGISEFSEGFQAKICPELVRFAALSVREQEGKRMLEDLLHRQVSLVLDPTFLLEQSAWEQEERSHPAGRSPYVLYYAVKSSEEMLAFARELARKKNRKLVVIGGNFLSNLRKKTGDVEYAWDISPRQWLYLCHHADCIVTNSFHGTAFSIHYQKDFYVEFSSYTNSRLRQIIQTTGLEDRIIGKNNSPFLDPIDYSPVVARLAAEKEASKAFLLKSLQ